MSDFLSNTWNPLCELLGSLIRPIGGLVFGGAIGWLAVTTFLDADKEWQLKVAIFLGLLGAFITLHIYSGPGTTGFFGLGAGIITAVLALRSMQGTKKK